MTPKLAHLKRLTFCISAVLLVLMVACGEDKPTPKHPFQYFANDLYADLQSQKTVELKPGKWNIHNIKWIEMTTEKEGVQYRITLTGDWEWTGDWSDARLVRFTCTLIFDYKLDFFHRLPQMFIEITSEPDSYDGDLHDNREFIREHLTPNIDGTLTIIYQSQKRYRFPTPQAQN